jgi:hypothetical protein
MNPEWAIGLNFKAVYYGVKYEAECMLKGGGRLVRLIAMGKVLALGSAKRMQLSPAGLGTRCG